VVLAPEMVFEERGETKSREKFLADVAAAGPHPEGGLSIEWIGTAVRDADRLGYTLYAVIYRPRDRFRAPAARAGAPSRWLTPDTLEWYRPFARDAQGMPLDVVIDWVGVPRTAVATQKGQAVLLTLAANSVIGARRSPAYWEAERRWRAGGHLAVVREREAWLAARVGG